MVHERSQMREAADPELVELRIRSTETVQRGGTKRIALTVFCPSRGCSTPLSECHSCSKCHGFQLAPDGRSGRLTCHVLEEVRPSGPRLAAPVESAARPQTESALNTKGAQGAMHTRVSEIMDCRTLCIEATFPVDELMPLMVARNVARVAVVDAAGGPLGILTKTDLLLRKHLDLTYRHASSIRQVARPRPIPLAAPAHEAPTVRTVRDVMTGGAFALAEAAPVARAAALMAHEGVESIVVISQHGHVVGLLSALDIARWVAESHGFAVRPG